MSAFTIPARTPMCIYCGLRPLTRDGHPIENTCTASECQQASFEAMKIWNALTRKSKLYLAERDPRTLDSVFGIGRENVARNVIDAVLVRADKYQRDMVKR